MNIVVVAVYQIDLLSGIPLRNTCIIRRIICIVDVSVTCRSTNLLYGRAKTCHEYEFITGSHRVTGIFRFSSVYCVRYISKAQSNTFSYEYPRLVE